MLIFPTLDTATDFSKDRISRMIQDCPSLTPLFLDEGKTRSANNTILSKYFIGGRLVLVGANSPAGLASKPIRVLLCDEIDRFPQSAGSEGDAISLAEKRQTTFWNRKTGVFSTPTVLNESRIDIAYEEGTQERWCHRCPNCGEYHFLDFKDMVLENDRCYWQCPDCGNRFIKSEMKHAKYIVDKPNVQGVRSFWINGFSSPWLSWEQIMQEYNEAKNNPVRESVVYNTRFGRSYEQRGEYDDENEFLKRRENYNAELPQGVLVLTAGVDVQGNRLEYIISGWGEGEECWQIRRGVIRGTPNDLNTWQTLDVILDKTYTKADGTAYKVARTFVDSGYNTGIVYDYCRRTPNRFAIKGKSAPGLKLIHSQNIIKDAGILLITLGVDDGKAELFSRLSVTEGTGRIHFGFDDEYLIRHFDAVFFKQLISEKRVVKKLGGRMYSSWEPITSHARNEALDISIYSYAAAKSLGYTTTSKPPARSINAQKTIDIWGIK